MPDPIKTKDHSTWEVCHHIYIYIPANRYGIGDPEYSAFYQMPICHRTRQQAHYYIAKLKEAERQRGEEFLSEYITLKCRDGCQCGPDVNPE